MIDSTDNTNISKFLMVSAIAMAWMENESYDSYPLVPANFKQLTTVIPNWLTSELAVRRPAGQRKIEKNAGDWPRLRRRPWRPSKMLKLTTTMEDLDVMQVAKELAINLVAWHNILDLDDDSIQMLIIGWRLGGEFWRIGTDAYWFVHNINETRSSEPPSAVHCVRFSNMDLMFNSVTKIDEGCQMLKRHLTLRCPATPSQLKVAVKEILSCCNGNKQ
ncbi:hypothetical protein VTP01DRAFT_1609 [Rhizomucor pusillus]|uniref:uncharacterized protein n=1 Tax=Rhizomucor pusillus TaxID=4840 RepID=UPI00374435EA